jgi:hypothetical protein
MNIEETIRIDPSIFEAAREDKDIILKLFAHYDKCYKYLAKSEEALDDLLEYCWTEIVNDGICTCADILFDTELYEREWVNFFKKPEDTPFYWAPPVGFAKSKEELLDFIGRRHTILHSLKMAIEA